MPEPFTLTREISPPPPKAGRENRNISSAYSQLGSRPESAGGPAQYASPTLATVEAGEADVTDHLAYFSAHLVAKSRAEPKEPRISIGEFRELWERNQHPHGRHFVVHQHNHPVAGVHYDLRLQFSQSSSVSFAIPYGLPGNPNTRRPGRMAIETRVHNLWNNLIESASQATGSLLIWDTGEYEILDRHPPAVETDDERSNASDVDVDGHASREPENVRLIQAFQNAHIRLRLHGTRLPKNYTVTLRLPSENNTTEQPRKPKRKRRRMEPSSMPMKALASSHEELEERDSVILQESARAAVTVLDNDHEDEDAQIRKDNAYTGATNSIGSVHQRRWYLSLDKRNSGFMKAVGKGTWTAGDGGGKGFKPFFVKGAEVERSVVTGRLSEEVIEDEGVEGFVARKMWRPVLE